MRSQISSRRNIAGDSHCCQAAASPGCSFRGLPGATGLPVCCFNTHRDGLFLLQVFHSLLTGSFSFVKETDSFCLCCEEKANQGFPRPASGEEQCHSQPPGSISSQELTHTANAQSKAV